MTATASTVLESILAIGDGTITGVTNAATATNSAVLNFAATPPGVKAGMVVKDVTTAAAITAATTTVTAVGPTTVTMSANAASGGVLSGDTIQFGSVTSTTKSAAFAKGADFRGILEILQMQCYAMMRTAAILKGLTDSGDTQTLANINEVLALMSATPYALPS